MEISLTLPLDEGFLRRQCPRCDRQFKWFSGETEGRPDDAVDPEVYFCPYCAATAPADEWWTKEQSEFALESMSGPALDLVARELEDALGPLNRSGLVTGSVDIDRPEPPASLYEPSDMVVVEAPCHPWEPVKVDDGWEEPFHCLVCGRPFTA